MFLTKKAHGGHGFRPALETLEDRCVPAGMSPPLGFTVLDYAHFQASGQGDVTTPGSLADGSDLLTVANAATWKVGHGVRVQRAGADHLVHSADSGWTLAPNAPAGASVSHDTLDRKEGSASVHGSFTGTRADADNDGQADPVDLFEVDLGSPADLAADELHLWIKSAKAVAAGDLRVRFYALDETLPGGRGATFELSLPALQADAWTEVFLELDRTNGHLLQFRNDHRVLGLRWYGPGEQLDVRMDDFSAVKDLVAQVSAIDGALLRLSQAAGRSVADALVYHDDTLAVRRWLGEANRPGGARLFAPAGVYYINQAQLGGVGGSEGSYSLPIYNNTSIRGAGAALTTFRNAGGPVTGVGVMFRSADARPENIVITAAGFDWNGWNSVDYGSVLLVRPHSGMSVSRNIHISGNRFFDSRFPGLEGGDRSQDSSQTRQRHHLMVYGPDGLWVENNNMSGGGRIKAGSNILNRNIYIRNNVLDFVNDNGITLATMGAGVTENVTITGNTIINPITSGIFFGADGEGVQQVDGMIVRDVTIANNRIKGFFYIGIIGMLPAEAERIRIVGNVIQSVRSRAIDPNAPYIAGIYVRNRADVAAPARDIRIERNTILATGVNAYYQWGILAGGRMDGLHIRNNVIRSEEGGYIGQGMWLHGPRLDNLELANNQISGAPRALEIATALTNARIHHNVITGGPHPSAGQVSFSAAAGETIHGQVYNNTIRGGTGHGILTGGEGDFDLLIRSNLITGNAGAGVSVYSGSGVRLSRNVIYGNGGPGIDLGNDGPTGNDADDSDTGPNQRQNYPEIASVIDVGAWSRVRGTVSTHPAGRLTLEFYVSLPGDGTAQARRFVGSLLLSTPSGGGPASFTMLLPRLPRGWVLTAAAADSRGNTSELSPGWLLGASGGRPPTP